ncbi:hypothetical protein ACFL6F_00435 [Planctomycetota bacterium]
MTIDTSSLFEPLDVRGKHFKNRIIMPPMVVLRGITTFEGIEWYRRHAQGGPALVIVEASEVRRFGKEFTSRNLKPLVDAIRNEGALAGIQLFPHIITEKVFPADLSEEDIALMISAYAHAASICRDAGFDAVEPHGAHNYILNLFFSPNKNKRTDTYGGSLENRMRLAGEIIEAVVPFCDDMLLMYRHTPVGSGYDMEESLQLARMLVNKGVDILDISPASDQAPGDRAEPFSGLGVPVAAVNRLSQPERAVEVLAEKRADLCAIGRGLIADPDWVIKVEENRFEDITECIDCNEMCFGNLRKKIPIACTQWKT